MLVKKNIQGEIRFMNLILQDKSKTQNEQLQRKNFVYEEIRKFSDEFILRNTL